MMHSNGDIIVDVHPEPSLTEPDSTCCHLVLRLNTFNVFVDFLGDFRIGHWANLQLLAVQHLCPTMKYQTFPR